MPILGPDNLDIISHSAEQTQRLGHRLAQWLEAGDVICLEGDLGTGKTCLTQGIGRGLGIVEPITSPSFTLVSEYQSAPGRPPLYHIDLYRLEEAITEALAIGLDEYLYGNGVCVIEWAERAAPVLPADRLWITLRHLQASKRSLLVQASGPRYAELLRRFRRSAFGL